MSKVLITREKLDDLAVAVAEKAGLTTPLTIAQMQTAVENLSPGGGTLITKNINANGTYAARDDSADGYSSVTVNVPTPTPTLQTKTKTYTPTESQQTESVSADAGYDGIDTVDVTVNAIPSNYVGSGVARNDSTNLTASGATVTAPAGYYANSASKTVASGSATPAASISGTSATVSTGTNTLTLSKTISNTPQVSAGYVSAGTAGNSNVSLTASVTTKAAATITPTTTNQTIASGTYLTGTQTISGDANLVAGNIKSGTTIFGVTGTYSGGGAGWQVDTKTITASNYPVSIEFTSMKGQPKAFFLKSTSQISSSGSTTYYYIIAMRYNGTNTTGSCFRIGSTRRVEPVTSGYSWSYSGTTLTITSSAASRSASPGAFNNGYELTYFY